MTPLVSIIIPAYNVEKYVGEAIDSVLSQKYRNFEVLISDDGSVDGTKRVIDKYQDNRIRRFHNPENIGQVLTKNRLLSEASGELITFLDADDYISADRLSLMVDAFAANPGLGLCGSNVARDFNGRINFLGEIPLCHEAIRAAGEGAFPAPAAVMISKKVYESIGGYREYFNGLCYEDHDWLMRVVEQFPARNLPNHLYFYRYRPESLGNQKFDSRKLAARTLALHLARQRREQGQDDLDSGNLAAVDQQMKSMLATYDRKEWQLYVELRRLTELRDVMRFVLMAKMLTQFPFSKVTYKGFLRALVPIGSSLDRKLMKIARKHRLFAR